ncbi:hypothetical protein BDR03DRAFT_946668 [Suillus americanus]|nr:hypothetical protein BDR03DRAFT_946668 [Suillus americanus]
MRSTIDDSTRMSPTTSINSDSQVLRNFQSPTRPILKSAFKVLCVVAVSRTSLDHWGNTKNDEWKEHVAVMIKRFQNSNVTAGLVLATAALLLASSPPITSLMAFDTPASYVFSIIAFSAALFSVISGAAVVVIYETSITHKDMECLRDMSRHQIICLLLWLAHPSICLAVATCSLFVSLFIACFCSGNVFVQVITALGCLAFFTNGLLTLHVLNFVGRRHAKPVDIERGSASKEVL